MAMWNPNGEAPADFLAELYGDEPEEEQLDDDIDVMVEVVGEELEEMSSDDDEIDPEPRSSSPAAPPYSPRTSPSRRESGGYRSNRSRSRGSNDQEGGRSRSRSRTRSRSRSPHVYAAAEPLVVIQVYDESGLPLTEAMGPEDVFVSPDAHALFDSMCLQSIERFDACERGDNHDGVIVERGAEVERHVRGRSVRGRVRGGRRARGSGRGRSGRGHGGGRCQRGGSSWKVGHPLEEIWVTDDDVPLELRELARDVVRRRQESVHVSTGGRRSTRDRNIDEGDDSASEIEDDVYYDAADGRDKTMLEGVDDLHFEWSPMETFRGEEESFRPERTGSVSSYTNPYDAFRSYWDDGILQDIVTETNRYATKISSPSFQSDWYPTNSDEMLCLFAFWMMMGIIRMPTVCSYFSANTLLKTEVFSRITTLKRYNSLNRALYFVDTEPATDAAYPTNSGVASFDRLYRLRPIIDHLNSKFQSNYVLSKDICIDESLTLWKGRLNFKQYIRTKAAKFGIKTFELCESATGYLWSFMVYTGKQSSFDLEGHMSKSAAVVRKLIKPLLNKGHRLFMDNWFNSPFLARFLKRNGTDSVGTLRPSRQHVPKLVTQAPLKQGQLIARHSGDVCVLSWQDKKRVNMITTCHGSAVGLSTVASHLPQRPLPYKPQAVLDYNRSMGGVDLKDQMLEPYLLERKRCAKWYLKLFKRLLNCSIHNSRVLLESSLNARQDNLKFRLELVNSILTHHHHLIPLGRRANASRIRSAPFPHIIHHTHWAVRIPPSQYEASRNRQGRQRCAFCWTQKKKDVRTGFKCEDCDMPLCIVDCFKAYHTTLSQ